MTSTLRITALAIGFVIIISAFSFIYPLMSRPDSSLIVSVDAELNGETDDYNLEYRSYSKDSQEMIDEIFSLRIANLGNIDKDNIVVTLSHIPESTDWYKFVSSEKTFGSSNVDLFDEKVEIDLLPAGETITIQYKISMNATSIGINNLLQEKSQLVFVVTDHENNRISEKIYNVRLPPS
tara:strand:+ start:2255 stop:2794 length:540 start_codon:yes stop_codon:yes gene_type:complete